MGTKIKEEFVNQPVSTNGSAFIFIIYFLLKKNVIKNKNFWFTKKLFKIHPSFFQFSDTKDNKSGNAGEPGHVPSIETNGTRKEQRMNNFVVSLLVLGRFSFNARLKRINSVRYRSPVMVSFGFNS